jgi:hypothetical protein
LAPCQLKRHAPSVGDLSLALIVVVAALKQNTFFIRSSQEPKKRFLRLVERIEVIIWYIDHECWNPDTRQKVEWIALAQREAIDFENSFVD